MSWYWYSLLVWTGEVGVKAELGKKRYAQKLFLTVTFTENTNSIDQYFFPSIFSLHSLKFDISLTQSKEILILLNPVSVVKFNDS